MTSLLQPPGLPDGSAVTKRVWAAMTDASRLKVLPASDPDVIDGGWAVRVDDQPPPAELSGRDLTLRQRQIMVLVASGLSGDEIGKCLFLAPSTVKFHISAILKKLGARNRTHAAVIWSLGLERRAGSLDALAAELEILALEMRATADAIRGPGRSSAEEPAAA